MPRTAPCRQAAPDRDRLLLGFSSVNPVLQTAAQAGWPQCSVVIGVYPYLRFVSLALAGFRGATAPLKHQAVMWHSAQLGNPNVPSATLEGNRIRKQLLCGKLLPSIAKEEQRAGGFHPQVLLCVSQRQWCAGPLTAD